MEFSKLLSNLKFKHEMLDGAGHSQVTDESEPIKGSNKTSKKLNNFIASSTHSRENLLVGVNYHDYNEFF